MKMYRTFSRQEQSEQYPSSLQFALDTGDSRAALIVAITVEKATEDGVWITDSSGRDQRHTRRGPEYEYFDTEEEARDAIRQYTKARIEKLEKRLTEFDSYALQAELRYRVIQCRMAIHNLGVYPVVVYEGWARK